MKPHIILIIHDIRSCHNVGSLMRTAEGLGIEKLYFTGYTPYPSHDGDTRLPHIARKLTAQIHKTALGAENDVVWEHREDITTLVAELKASGYVIGALEQSGRSVRLPDYHPPEKIAVILGREVEGIDADIIGMADVTLEIPMFGQKESFNVVQAAAMTLYHLRFH
ncbi:MAG: tRNA methyltransferase [Candidatus Saccharibacteria bacterium]|nr:tRNA methyltransferase [Candidatus Saccharibacteria bacterium]